MKDTTYDRLRKIGGLYQGYICTEQLMMQGFTNRQIGTFVDEGYLERISHGNYWIVCGEYTRPHDHKAIEVCLANPKAVICADSACFYQGLISQEPKYLSVATLRTDRSKMQMNFPVTRHYYSELNKEHYQTVRTDFGNYHIFNIERSVCDCIRFRSDLEEGMLNLILERYQEKSSGKYERLLKYAQMLHVEKQVRELL